MSNNTAPSFINRLISNDSARRGVAAAVAGVIVAAISETLWPTGT